MFSLNWFKLDSIAGAAGFFGLISLIVFSFQSRYNLTNLDNSG